MRKNYITVLNVICCFAVVILHVNGIFWTFSKDFTWISANVIENIFYPAVPIFFMITGCNLLDYRDKYSTKEYAIKRIKKVFLPFLAWSLIGLVSRVIYMEYPLSEQTLTSIISQILCSNIVEVFWFFSPLFVIYICIPALSMIDKKDRQSIFKYLIVAAFVMNAVFPFIMNQLHISYDSRFRMSMMMDYLIFPLIGYYIDRYNIEKKYRNWLYIAGAVSVGIMIIGSQILSFRDGAVNGTFKGYTSMFCILYSSAIYTFFKNKKWENTSKVVQICSQVASLTFGVYLTPWFIIRVVKAIFHIGMVSLPSRVVSSFVVFVIALIVVKIMKQIPGLKHLVP